MIGLGGLVGAAGSAAAAIVTYDSDTAFNANAGFTKQFGYNVRGGNGTASGDWEYAIVNASDSPIGAAGQLGWSSGSNLHDFDFKFTPTNQATLDLSNVTGSPDLTRTVTGTGINAVALRARAEGSGVSNLSNLKVTFTDLTFVALSSLVGDNNAEWIMLVDSRLANGFSITGTADFDRAGLSGSRVMYQAKVGVSPVPVPAALPLLGTALAWLGVVGWRRRNSGTAPA